MAEALAVVKKSLGADAVILHTRTYKRGGIWGIGARTVVEVTAAQGREYRQALRAKAAAKAAMKPLAGSSASSPRASTAALTAPVTKEQAAGDLIRRTYAVAQAALAQRTAQGTCANPDSALRTVAKTAQPQASIQPIAAVPDAAQLAREMQAVKRMVARMMHQGYSPPKPREPGVTGTDPLLDKYTALLEQEVSRELADEVIRKVHKTLGGKDLDDEAAVRAAIRRELAALLPAAAPPGPLEPTADGRPRVMAFVGPTGVGKTTTVAKLAAQFKLKQKKRVGLITLDTFRIAAVDQLRTYANIIGVPLRVVSTPPEVVEALRDFEGRGCDVVLIDTAGRSQRDEGKLEQLENLMRAAQPHEVHLVLCASCSQMTLLETVERFARVRTDRIIFTKLDEAAAFGVLMNVAHRVNKKLSYITTGQEVPHDIEIGLPDRLAGLLLGEELKRC